MPTPERQTVNLSSYPDLAPLQPARGGMFSSRGRLGAGGEAAAAPVYTEEELYG
jgi:hypothetical protein